MTDKPNAKLNETQVWSILTRLRNIRLGNLDKDSQIQIANDFGVDKKTISRIHTGKTWETVKQRFDESPNNRVDNLPRIANLVPLTETLLDLINTVNSVKEHFALDHDGPLHYGKFDWIDGVHSVVSEGTILWESSTLYKLARQIEKSGVKDSPLFAQKANELPTFEIANMLTHHPMNDRYVSHEHCENGVVRLACTNGRVAFLQPKYFSLVARDSFQVYAAGERSDLVYLTRTKENKHSETTIIHACVATMQA